MIVRRFCRRSIVGGFLTVGVVGLFGALMFTAPAWGRSFAFRFERELKPASGSFGSLGASSVAVDDESGDTYVADSGSGVVDVFDTATGVQVGEWNGSAGTNPPLGAPGGSFGGGKVSVAADNTTGDVYVLDATDNVVDELAPTGEYLCQITGAAVPSATECNGAAGSLVPSGGFEDPGGIAVDQATGDVYVADGHHGAVDVFGTHGEYLAARSISLSEIPGEEAYNADFLRGVASDDFNGEVFASDVIHFGVFEFSSADGEYVTTWHGSAETNPPGVPQGGFERFLGVAADNASGNVYVSESIEQAVDVFAPSDGYLTQITHSFAEPRGVAVDQATGGVDVADAGRGVVDVFAALPLPEVKLGSPTEPEPTSVTLHGAVNPEGIAVTSCEFEYGTSTSFGSSEKCSPNPGSGSGEVQVKASLEKLQPDTPYDYRLSAGNTNGTNTGGQPYQEGHFTTPGPGIAGSSVSNVASSSVTFEAAIDPNASPTSVYFQYSTSSTTGCTPRSCASVPAAPGEAIGSGDATVAVSHHEQGLLAATTYHYRVVVLSDITLEGGARETQEFAGSDQTFTTQAAGGELTLLDGRQWELVSPPDKHGSAIEPLDSSFGGLIQASADGSAITYVANGPVTGEPAGNRAPETVQVMSRRGAGGWATQDIATPHNHAWEVATEGPEYKFFSPDLSLAAVEPAGETLLSPEATERTIYLRDDATGDYRPLVTAANVPPGTQFGGNPEFEGGTSEVQFKGGTPDLSHVVLDSNVALTPGAGEGLYEWADGKFRLVGLDGQFGSGGNRRNAISTDGSRIVWHEGETGLYLWDGSRGESGESIQLNVAQPGASGVGPEGPQSVRFQIASSDDSKIFFTDEEGLTADSVARRGHPDLYECEIVEEAGGKPACVLTDLSVSENPGEAGDVEGAVLGASEDGSYVYFIAGGVLAPGGRSGAQNLYLSHGGKTKFIGELSEYGENLAGLKRYGELALQPTRVSPDGKFLAFVSDHSLTGYDNRDAVSGEPDDEVYLYDAESGHLVCVSCNPTGARPVGLHDVKSQESILGPLVDRGGIFPEQWVAASLPGWPEAFASLWDSAMYQSPYLSDSGRLFFDSADALVAQDTNGVEDVYEYEPLGVGGPSGCTVASSTFSAGKGGCVGLISSGISGEESAFMGASESGEDVFFLTAGRLVPQDVDSAYDIYDAHVCSAAVPCPGGVVSPPACSTIDACRAAVSPQPAVFGAPPSATFSGVGNLSVSGSLPMVKAKKPAVRPKKKRKRKTRRRGARARRLGSGKGQSAWVARGEVARGVERGRGA